MGRGGVLRSSIGIFPIVVLAGFAGMMPASGEAFVGSTAETEIVSHYLSAAGDQQSLMRGSSIDVEIRAEVPKLHKQGKLHALKQVSKLGQITYRALGF